MLNWQKVTNRPIIVAHRGFSAVAPENTLAAIRQAVIDGADAVEIDVRFSKDGEVVVIHDEKLQRTTSGRGRVSDYTLKELRQLSAGAWFGKEFKSELIPTLDEVIECVKNQVGLNIEIKRENNHRNKEIVSRCIQIIRCYDVMPNVMISSFHYPLIRQVKLLEPSITVGILYNPLIYSSQSICNLTKRLMAEYFICSINSLRVKMVDTLHKKFLKVGVYSIDTEKYLTKVLKYDVDAIFTNNPKVIRKIYYQKCPSN